MPAIVSAPAGTQEPAEQEAQVRRLAVVLPAHRVHRLAEMERIKRALNARIPILARTHGNATMSTLNA